MKLSKEDATALIAKWNANQDKATWAELKPWLTAIAVTVFRNHRGVKMPNRDEVIDEMVIHAVLGLSGFDANKGSAMNWVFTNMKRYLVNCYRYNTNRRRDFRQTSYFEEMRLKSDVNVLDVIATEEPSNDIFQNNEFRQFACEWFRKHKGHFTPTENKHIAGIVDILSKMDGTVDIDRNDIGYKLDLEPSYVNHIYRVMRRHAKRIVRDYLEGNDV